MKYKEPIMKISNFASESVVTESKYITDLTTLQKFESAQKKIEKWNEVLRFTF